MNTNKTLIVAILIGALTILKSFGQETPKQLGIDFLKSLKTKDTTEIKKIIPEAETLMGFSKTLGIEKTKNETFVFLTTYPNEVNQFINRFMQLNQYGERIGIDWDLVKFSDVEISSREQKISENEKPIILTTLNVIFVCKNVSYRLILNSVFEFNKK